MVLAVPLLAVVSSAYWTNRQAPVFRAATEIAVAPSPDLTDPSDVMRGLETLERRTVIATFASIAETRETLAVAAARLGLEVSELRGYRVLASVVPRTNIIRISVEGGDGERVSLLANALATVAADEAKTMYKIFEMRPLEAARTARRPFHPDPSRNALIGAILGVFLGLLSALALDHVRSSGSPGEASTSSEKKVGHPSKPGPGTLTTAFRK
jgi:capsular polysaccharide biosynthesis protein